MNTEDLLIASEHLSGFLIVMVTLALLAVVTSLLGRWFAKRDAIASTSLATVSSGHDDMVVVAAAAAALIDQPHRVVKVRREASSSDQ